MEPGSHAATDIRIVEYPDHGGAATAGFIDEFGDALGIGGVERGGRFVEQQDRLVGDQAARDVDALLLAAGEGRRRQMPEAFGQVQPRQQDGRSCARRSASTPRPRSGSATMSRVATRGITRRNWLT